MQPQEITVHTVTLSHSIYGMFNKKGDCIGECYPCTEDNTSVVRDNPEGWYLVTALWFPEGHGCLFWAVDYEFDTNKLDNYINNKK